ncbi:hypothetical protein KP509_17G025500 [Ceratopteris richardii]|nr:hypothetical protein KP509_17G025500 [Ceratopteris richardii]
MDLEVQEIVAVKVVRNVKKYKEDAMIEINHLQTIGKNDRSGSRGCVQMKRWFDYQNHVCIVFEKLGSSLFDFLKENDFQPFSVDQVRCFGRQLLESVAYIHSLNLIHTDLKPENILLVSSDYKEVVDYRVHKHASNQPNPTRRAPRSSRIKLIDFGGTTYDGECSFLVVSTRHYRAPEVILGSGWSYPCDIWSIACILLELCSGKVLFQTRDDLEHLAMMERVIGPIPSYMIRKSKGQALKYFIQERKLNWPDRYTSRDSIRAVLRIRGLRDLVMNHADKSSRSLLDLLQQMFCYDPSKRITAKEALQHPFLQVPLEE